MILRVGPQQLDGAAVGRYGNTGGLRGALTITLALALPADIPARQLLIEMAFGVVLFTLLVQGVTLSLVLQRAGLVRPASEPGTPFPP